MTEIWLEGSIHRGHNQPDLTAQLVDSANHVHLSVLQYQLTLNETYLYIG